MVGQCRDGDHHLFILFGSARSGHFFHGAKNQRNRAIRKVLGATVSAHRVDALPGYYRTHPDCLADRLAAAWFFMNGWPQDFAYKIPLSGWMFVAAGAAAIGIALLTVRISVDQGGKGQSGEVIAH